MNPVWIAIGGLTVSTLALAATLVGHLVKHSYAMGQRDQRIAALEARPHDSDCATQLAALTATLVAFKSESERRMDGIDQAVHSLRNAFMAQQPKTTTRRAAG